MADEYDYNPYPTPDRKGTSDVWLSVYRDIYPYLFGNVISVGGVRRILDGASGLGTSMLVLNECIPGAKIVAVGYDKPLDDIRKKLGKRLEFKQDDFRNYLRRNRNPFDLVNIARAGYVMRDSADDYEALSRNVSSGGYVVTIFDTKLDSKYMNRFFTPLTVPRYSDTISVWQK